MRSAIRRRSAAVRDIENAEAASAQIVDDGEQAGGLGGCQAGGRLVEDQHGCIRGDGARDRDELAMSGAEIAEIGVERHVEPYPGRDGLGTATDTAASGKRADAAAAELVEQQVFGDGKARHAQLLGRLVDDDDAGLARRPWRGEQHVAAGDGDRPRIGSFDAGGDLGEGRFAGAIGTHQRQDFATLDRQIDAVERLGRTIAFGDTPKVQGRRTVNRRRHR
jgi:hypothetical protein